MEPEHVEGGIVRIRSGTWRWLVIPVVNVFEHRNEFKIFSGTDPQHGDRQLMRHLVGSFPSITERTAAELARHAQSRRTRLLDGRLAEFEFMPAPQRAAANSLDWGDRDQSKRLQVTTDDRQPMTLDVANDFLLGDLTEDEIRDLVMQAALRVAE